MNNHAGSAKTKTADSDGQFHRTNPTCIGYSVIRKYPENRVCPRIWHSVRSFFRNPSTIAKIPSPIAHTATSHAIAVRLRTSPRYAKKPRFERCIVQFNPVHSITNPFPTVCPNETLLLYNSPSNSETYSGTMPSHTAPKSRNGATSSSTSLTR